MQLARIKVGAGLCVVGLSTFQSEANPVGGQVVAGSVTLPVPGAAMQVGVHSTRSIIDWKSFSISNGELTRFNFDTANSAVLNRVTELNAANLSVIAGRLEANGTVLLLNPNGIFVGPSGRIDTHGFIGSTLPLDPGSFLNETRFSYTFRGNSGASIVNEGRILAKGSEGLPGGDVILIAQSVRNEGVLESKGGTVGLAAGHEVILQDTGAERLMVVTGSADGSVVNTARGAIDAATAELKAAGGNIGALAINNEGVIRATRLVEEGGRIFLRAGDGLASNSGVLDASGQKGGEVQVSGAAVGLASGSLINVNGENGGGQVTVGGGFQGAEAGAPNSSRTLVSPGARIEANALRQGDGGNVVVWSEQATAFAGTIQAHGGSQGGQGGSAEVSSRGTLFFSGQADLTAAKGARGTLLLDPTQIDVVATDPGDGSFTANLVSVANFATANIGATRTSLSVGSINTATANVTLQATDAINFNAPINTTVGLTAQVNGPTGTIAVNQPIQAASLDLSAFSITLNAAGTTVAPSVSTTGGQTYAGAVTLNAKTVLTSTGAGNISFGATVNGAAALDVNTTGATSFAGAIGATAALTELNTDFGTGTPVGGNTTFNGASVNTSASQVYNDNVVLAGAGAVRTFVSPNLLFAGNVDAGSKDVVLNATTSFLGSGGGDSAINFASLTAGGTLNLGVTTLNTGAGLQSYQALVLNAAGVQLTGGNISIANGIDGVLGQSITLNPSVKFTLGGVSKNLFNLTVNGNTEANNAIVGSSGGQIYAGDLTVGPLSTALNAPTVAINGNVGGTGALLIGGDATLGGVQANQVSGISSLNISGTTTLNAGTVTTTPGNQTYAGAVNFAGGDKTLTGTAVLFGNNLNAGNNGLDVQGNVTFGTTPANTVTGLRTLNVSGATLLNAPGINTGAGAQAYGGTISLLGGNKALTGSTIGLNGGGNGNGNALVLNGASTFGGSLNALSSLTVNGDATLNAATINSTGNQDFNGNVQVNSGATALNSTAGSVAIDGNVAGTGSLAIGADAVLGDSDATIETVTGLSGLIVDRTTTLNAGTVTTPGGLQDYKGAVSLLGGNTTLTAAAVTFGNDLNGGNNGLAIAGNATFGGTPANAVAALTALNVSGNATLNVPAINTGTGPQSFGGLLVLVGGDKTLTGGTLALNGGGNGNNNGLVLNGASTLSGAFNNLSTLAVNGDATLNAATIASTGNQDFNGNVQVNSGLTSLNATAGTVAIDGDVSGTGALAIGANAVLGDADAPVETVTGLASLTVNGTTTFNAGTVTTTGSQDYRGDAVLATPATQLTASSAASDVRFGGTVNGDSALTVTAPGTTTLGGAVGNTTPLRSLTTDSLGTTRIEGGSVVTTGAQSFGDDVVLNSGAAGDLTTLSGSQVTFAKTVRSATDGRDSLTVQSPSTVFQGAVGDGGRRLAALTTDPTGVTQIRGGAVTTTGAQDYQDEVLLDAVGNNTVLAGNSVRFGKTVRSVTDGEDALSVNAAATTFVGAVGDNSQRLASLGTDAPGTTFIQGGAVTTTGAQNYADAVVLDAAANKTVITGNSVTFGSTLRSATDGEESVLVNATTTVFNGVVGGGGQRLSSLETDAAGTTSLGADVNTTGAQTFRDAVQLNADVVITSTGNGDVDFASTVNSDSGATARSLEVRTGGATRFRDQVGTGPDRTDGNADDAPLRALTTDAQGLGKTVLGDTAVNSQMVVKSRIQRFDDAVELGANTVLKGDLGTAFDATASVDVANVDSAGAARDLTIVGLSGTTALGAINAASLVDAGANVRGLDLGTANPLGALDIQQRTPLISGGGPSPLPYPVPSIPSLPAPTVPPGPSLIRIGGDRITTGPQTYLAPVVLARDVRLASTAGGDIRFDQTVDSDSTFRKLEVDTAGRTIFNGRVGGVSRLAELGTDQQGGVGERTELNIPGSVNAPSVTTDGQQVYRDNVQLGADTVLNGARIDANRSIQGTTRSLTTVSDELNLGTSPADVVAVREAHFANRTAGRSITLGSKVPASLSLTDAELDRVVLDDPSTGVVRIGSTSAANADSTAGRIEMTAPITLDPSKVQQLSLINHSDVVDSAGAGSIAVDRLRISSEGPVTLASTANNVATLAVEVTQPNRDVKYTDADSVRIGVVDGVQGIGTLGTGRSLLRSVAGAITADPAVSITSSEIALEANSGLGTQTEPLKTVTGKLEAKTQTGGIFIQNTGDLEIGDVDPGNGFVGVQATQSGNVRIDVADKALTIAQPIEAKDGDVELNHDGALVDTTATTQTGVTVSGAGRSLILRGRGAVGTSGQRLKTDVSTLVLDKTSVSQPVGDTRIAEKDGIALSGTTLGALDIKANVAPGLGGSGDITDSSTLTVGGAGKALTLDATGPTVAQNGNILLDDAASTVSGVLYLKGKNVEVTENSPTLLGQSAATGDLLVRNLSGGIVETAVLEDGSIVPAANRVLEVAGSSTFIAPANQSILLKPTESTAPADPNQFVGPVAFRVVGDSGSLQNVTVIDNTDLVLRFEDGAKVAKTLPLNGDLNVVVGGSSAGKQFSQDSAVNAQGEVRITATGDALLNQSITAVNDITVDSRQSIYQSAPVQSTGANVGYTADSSITTTASTTAKQNIVFEAGTLIDQSGSAQAGNDVRYDAGTSIRVNNALIAANDFIADAGTTFEETATGPITVGRDTTVTAGGTVVLDQVVDTARDLTITAQDDIRAVSTTSALKVGGVTRLDATTLHDVLADQAANDFRGDLQIVAARTAKITDANALNFGAGTTRVETDLNVRTGGAVTQTEPISVGNRFTVVTRNDAGADVTLALEEEEGGPVNQFRTISVKTLKGTLADPDSTGTAAAGNITLNDIDGYVLGDVKTAATLRLNSGGGVESENRTGTGVAAVVEAKRLEADLGGGLLLGNDTPGTDLVPIPNQPANRIDEFGPVSVNGNTYVFDSDSKAYADPLNTGFFLNPARTHVVGLELKGNLTQNQVGAKTVVRTTGDMNIAQGVTVSTPATATTTGAPVSTTVLSAEADLTKPGTLANFHNLGTLTLGAGSRLRIYSFDDDLNTFSASPANEVSQLNGVGRDPGPYKFGTFGPVTFGEPVFNSLFASSKNTFDDATVNGPIALHLATAADAPGTEGTKFSVFQLRLDEVAVIDVETDADKVRTVQGARIVTSSFEVYDLLKQIRAKANR